MDVTQYQLEIIRLAEENTVISKKLKECRRSEGWVRRTVLQSLFIGVAFFVALAIGGEIFGLESTENIYAVVTSLLSMLSLAIGFYFKNENN